MKHPTFFAAIPLSVIYPSNCWISICIVYSRQRNNKDKDKDRYVKLFTDSQSSIQALNSHEVNSLAVKDTKNSLNLVGQKINRLENNWIKAHVGHSGNELADQLAKDVISQTEKVHGLFPPHSHFKADLWTAMYKLWTHKWQTQETCRISKNFLPRPSGKRLNKSFTYPENK